MKELKLFNNQLKNWDDIEIRKEENSADFRIFVIV